MTDVSNVTLLEQNTLFFLKLLNCIFFIINNQFLQNIIFAFYW